jgi:hypothetical protein
MSGNPTIVVVVARRFSDYQDYVRAHRREGDRRHVYLRHQDRTYAHRLVGLGDIVVVRIDGADPHPEAQALLDRMLAAQAVPTVVDATRTTDGDWVYRWAIRPAEVPDPAPPADDRPDWYRHDEDDIPWRNAFYGASTPQRSPYWNPNLGRLHIPLGNGYVSYRLDELEEVRWL